MPRYGKFLFVTTINSDIFRYQLITTICKDYLQLSSPISNHKRFTRQEVTEIALYQEYLL